jgi:N-acyl-D-aspartate/D-glutamate deacylase/CubicO group peptidase (beta-lactamase class C family)
MAKFYWFSIACLGLRMVYAQPTPTQIATIDSALTKLYERGMLNGVFLLAQDGKAVYKKAFGISNLTTREPLKTTSAFNLASISKQFTSMMIMMLKEKGRLNYDDKVQRHLAEFPYSNITIRHLLNHTSGLPEYFDLATQYYNTLDTLTNDKTLQLLKNHRPNLAFEPNTKFSYCNTGYVLLASVIEKASGMLIQDYFNQQIVKPLGLKDTYIYNFTIKQYPTNRVFGIKRENGQMLPNDLVRLDGVSGDGNVYSSVEDLLTWEQALYTEKLVSASTLKEAFAPAKLSNGKLSWYGFGWMLDEAGQKVSHTGGWVGFLNKLVRYTKQKWTVIGLTSSSDPTAHTIVQQILEGKIPKLPETQLITNANLIDGTGTPARKSSVRMKDNKIWEIGDLQPFPNETITNANGLTLAPGFIDAHSHHFGGLENHPAGEALVSQGITTIVIGQDGGSIPIDAIQSRMNKRPVAVNVATYTGHSTLRSKAMGAKSLYRTAKPEEIEKMKAELKTEMSKGSLGLATGLEYESAFFSNRDEVLQLAKVAAEAGGRYISHIRSEDVGLEEALDEIIDIGAQTKMPVQVSHIKIAKRDQWGRSSEVLTKLQKARSEGIKITADCYPYDFWNSTLRVLFPKRDYTNLESAEFAVNQLFDPAGSVLVRFAPNVTYAGKTIAEIANIRNEKPAQTLMALIAQAGDFEIKNPDYKGSIETIMGKSMSETDVANFLAWPFTGICSDGGWGGHPRGYGAFTRVLGNYVRTTKTLTLETAVYKMTALTAESLGLPNRGMIKVGYFADLVLFNPNTVKDNANIQNSTALSSGIEKVWVNGQLVYQNQQPTGQFSGVFIAKPPTPQWGN